MRVSDIVSPDVEYIVGRLLYTLQLGFAGSGNFWGFAIPAGFGFATDTSGNFGFYGYSGVGITSGADVEAGISIQVSNAQTTNDLRGPFLNARAGLGLGGSVDYFRGPSDNGWVSGAGVTVSLAAGASVTAAVTGTSVYVISGK